MSLKQYSLLSIVLGLICGFVSSHDTIGWLNLFFWIIAGILVVYFSPSRRAALYAGKLFGFFTIATWLITGFEGTPDKFVVFAAFSFGLAIMGGLCGLAGAALFNKLAKRS